MPSNRPWKRTPGYRTVAAAEDLVDTDVRVGNLERRSASDGLVEWEDVEGLDVPLAWTQSPAIPFIAICVNRSNVFGGQIHGNAPPAVSPAYTRAGTYDADTGVFTRVSSPLMESISGVFDLTDTGIALYTEPDAEGVPVAPGVTPLGPAPAGYYPVNIRYPDYRKYTVAVNNAGVYLYVNWALSGGGFGYPGHMETIVRKPNWEAVAASHGNPVIVQDLDGANEPVIFESGTSFASGGQYRDMDYLSTKPFLLNDGTVAYTYNEAIVSTDGSHARIGNTTLAKYWDGTTLYTCPEPSRTFLLGMNEKRVAICLRFDGSGSGYHRIFLWDCNDFTVTYLDTLCPEMVGQSQIGGAINSSGAVATYLAGPAGGKIVVVKGTTMRTVATLQPNHLVMSDDYYIYANTNPQNYGPGVQGRLFKPA